MRIVLGTSGLDWPRALRFLALRAVPGVEDVVGDRYARTFRYGADAGLVEIGPGGDGGLVCTVRGADGADDAVSRARRLLDLDADTAAIGAHLRGDPWLAPLVEAHGVPRVTRGWDGFETAARAILGQQVSIARAQVLNGRLAARCGTRLASGTGPRVLFPTPEQVVRADLSDLGVPGARARALHALAEATLADPRLFDGEGPLEEIVARLTRIRGIGPWTAQYVAMRACGHGDAFPASDVGLLRGAADPAGARPSPTALLARAEAWRPWRAYAAQVLWAADAARR